MSVCCTQKKKEYFWYVILPYTEKKKRIFLIYVILQCTHFDTCCYRVSALYWDTPCDLVRHLRGWPCTLKIVLYNHHHPCGLGLGLCGEQRHVDARGQRIWNPLTWYPSPPQPYLSFTAIFPAPVTLKQEMTICGKSCSRMASTRCWWCLCRHVLFEYCYALFLFLL